MNEKIATDLDGVLATNKHDVADYRPWRLHKWYSLCEPTERCDMDYDIILTGRRVHYKKITIRWLEENNVNYDELVMFPNKVKKNNKTLREYKAKVIKYFGIDNFFEDDERIFKHIKNECPNVNTELIRFD